MKKTIIASLLALTALTAPVANVDIEPISADLGVVSVSPSDIFGIINQARTHFVTIGGQTYAPLRAVAEDFGATVTWDNPTRTATVSFVGAQAATTFGNILGTDLSDDILPGTFSISLQENTNGTFTVVNGPAAGVAFRAYIVNDRILFPINPAALLDVPAIINTLTNPSDTLSTGLLETALEVLTGGSGNLTINAEGATLN